MIFERLSFPLDQYPLLNLLYIIGAWSPAIASFTVLRKKEKVASLKEWLKTMFTIKSAAANYLLLTALFLIYMASLIVTSGLKSVTPGYMFFVWLLASLLLGLGWMEETGWRYILHGAVNKKCGYLIACLTVAPIHLLWHVPLGVGELFLWNAINILGLSFAIGAVYNISNGNIFLCILFHCMINAGPRTLMPNQTVAGITITTAVMIIASLTAVSLNKHILARRSQKI